MVVISDYAKGLVSEALVHETNLLCKKAGVQVAVDPRSSTLITTRGYDCNAK